MITSNSSIIEISLIILLFPGLGSIAGAQKCELNPCVLREKLLNFSFDEDTRTSKWWERKLCLIFTKFCFWHFWLRNTWSLLSSWLAPGHNICTCVQHPHPGQKCCAQLPPHGRTSRQLSRRQDRCLCFKSSERWSKVPLQVITLIMQIKFREAKRNLIIVYSEMDKS